MNEHSPDMHMPPDVYQWMLKRLLEALPPPLTDTPEGRAERDQAAIAAVEALAPANASEASLGTQSIIAEAHARYCLIHACDHAANLTLLRRYNAMAKQLTGAARATRRLLARMQAARQKRDAGKTPGAGPAPSRRRKTN